MNVWVEVSVNGYPARMQRPLPEDTHFRCLPDAFFFFFGQVNTPPACYVDVRSIHQDMLREFVMDSGDLSRYEIGAEWLNDARVANSVRAEPLEFKWDYEIMRKSQVQNMKRKEYRKGAKRAVRGVQ
jgi:hypothetical protein